MSFLFIFLNSEESKQYSCSSACGLSGGAAVPVQVSKAELRANITQTRLFMTMEEKDDGSPLELRGHTLS